VKQGQRTIDLHAFRFEWFIVIIGEAIRAVMGDDERNPRDATAGLEKRDGKRLNILCTL